MTTIMCNFIMKKNLRKIFHFNAKITNKMKFKKSLSPHLRLVKNFSNRVSKLEYFYPFGFLFE